MRKVVQLLVCSATLLAPAAAAAQDAAPQADQAMWTKYAGVWRVNSSLSEPADPGPYVLLRIDAEPDALVVVRSGNAVTETLSYPTNGSEATSSEKTGTIVAKASLDGPTLLLRSERKGPDGKIASTMVDSVVVSPNRLRLTVERTVTTGKDEKKFSIVFNRIPGNFLTHGGTGAQGPTNEKPEERGLPPEQRERPADKRR